MSKPVKLVPDSNPPTHSAAKRSPSSGASGSQTYDGWSRRDLQLMTWQSTDSHLRQSGEKAEEQVKGVYRKGERKVERESVTDGYRVQRLR